MCYMLQWFFWFQVTIFCKLLLKHKIKQNSTFLNNNFSLSWCKNACHIKCMEERRNQIWHFAWYMFFLFFSGKEISRNWWICKYTNTLQLILLTNSFEISRRILTNILYQLDNSIVTDHCYFALCHLMNMLLNEADQCSNMLCILFHSFLFNLFCDMCYLLIAI